LVPVRNALNIVFYTHAYVNVCAMCYLKTYQQQYCKYCNKVINKRDRQFETACASVGFKVKNFGKCGRPTEKLPPEKQHDEKKCKKDTAAKKAQREEEIAQARKEDAEKAREELKKKQEREAKALEKQLKKGELVKQKGK
jgi:hypothetical protein